MTGTRTIEFLGNSPGATGRKVRRGGTDTVAALCRAITRG